MSNLSWKPSAWSAHVSRPDEFMRALKALKPPPKSILAATYLSCVENGFQVIKDRPDLHVAYFNSITNSVPEPSKLPNDSSIQFIVGRMCSQHARVESLLWHNRINSLWRRKKEDLFHWVLTLSRSGVYDNYDVALDPSYTPAWAQAYIQYQRTGSTKEWRTWLGQEDLQRVIDVAIAVGRYELLVQNGVRNFAVDSLKRVMLRLVSEVDSPQVTQASMCTVFDLALMSENLYQELLQMQIHVDSLSSISSVPILQRYWLAYRLDSQEEKRKRFSTYWYALSPEQRGMSLASSYGSSCGASFAMFVRKEQALRDVLTSASVKFNKDQLLSILSNPGYEDKDITLICSWLPGVTPLSNLMDNKLLKGYIIDNIELILGPDECEELPLPSNLGSSISF